MKKFTAILLSFIICFAFFGCSADIQTDTANTPVSEITSESTTVSELTGTLTDDTKNELNAKETEHKTTTEKGTSKSTSATAKSTSISSKTTTKATTKKTTPTKSSTTTTKKSTTKKQTTTSSTITCSVTVECKSVLGNMDNLKAGHESYVPSDGYIINGYTVTIPNGSTAYDAVKTACDRQGVSMNVSNSSFGKYIAGFNNIDEKDCGRQSGWLYFVNGTSPSKSCDKYTLSNGDNVVFSYTCS
ncbi:MAG: DUF4430 domain-containing protein [Eubacterium sp.]|nr:DUF4430 domain-containing protein [Eubacterium sp.]